MSIAPDYSAVLASLDLWPLIKAVLAVGYIALMLVLVIFLIHNILKLFGYDVMDIYADARAEARYRDRYRRESDEQRYSKWKEKRGY